MNNKYQNITKQIVIYLFLVALAVSSTALAQRSRRDGTDRQDRMSEKESRKEQMRQEAEQSFPELSKALRGILQKAAKNQFPEPNCITTATQLLEENKRYGRIYDDKQKAQFMLLQAWTGFYQDNPVDAVRWSMRACKTNEASQDAWISQVLFCMLNDKRPMKPRQKKPRSNLRRRPRRNADEAEFQTRSKPFSEKGVLEFDLMGLREKVFRQQFGRLEFLSVSGEEIKFKPDGDMLCILFWQDDTVSEDAEDTVDDSEKKDKQAAMMLPDGMMPMNVELGTGLSSDSAKTDLDAQRKYFQRLIDAYKDKASVKFVQINTTHTGNTETFLNELSDYSDEPILTVVAAKPNSGAEQFAGWPAEKPFMMIVDKNGKVKYAGTAADFMPAFILTALTGVEIDLGKQKQPVAPKQRGGPMPDEKMEFSPMFMPGMPGMPPAKAPKPPEPNVPDRRQRPAERSSDFPTQSLEDQLRAENLLRAAQMHIEESRKLHMKNPKQGIEAARQVLQEFPGTQFAQQARELLRRVPDRWKKQHHITDEELGY
ncbi:MAG: hypothetical protein B6I25_04025 [Planctomycetales bacterium 4572_13]|nr:MAG: hypothetical protein B6I25_04025 [Planctomycetales bacterium 4572_13]